MASNKQLKLKVLLVMLSCSSVVVIVGSVWCALTAAVDYSFFYVCTYICMYIGKWWAMSNNCCLYKLAFFTVATKSKNSLMRKKGKHTKKKTRKNNNNCEKMDGMDMQAGKRLTRSMCIHICIYVYMYVYICMYVYVTMRFFFVVTMNSHKQINGEILNKRQTNINQSSEC